MNYSVFLDVSYNVQNNSRRKSVFHTIGVLGAVKFSRSERKEMLTEGGSLWSELGVHLLRSVVVN